MKTEVTEYKQVVTNDNNGNTLRQIMKPRLNEEMNDHYAKRWKHNHSTEWRKLQVYRRHRIIK